MITNDLDWDLKKIICRYDSNQIFLLTDDVVSKSCLPLLLQIADIPEDHILIVPNGENCKTLQTITQIWDFLIDHQATRRSVLLNLGGGVITDMGGFAASCFKRGIDYINLPTTLLSMVDAALGGKTGFNYRGLKNEIGVICPATETIVYVPFCKSLPFSHFLSGYAEMLKHALIASPLELLEVLALDLNNPDEERLQELIRRSQDIKAYIVEQDPTEQSLRKALNFGHTIGHALEEYSMQIGQPMLHGYAVLYGMIGELYLSYLHYGFPKDTLQKVVRLMTEFYGRPQCACGDYEVLLNLMRHDKKNSVAGEINFTLLRLVGNPRLDQHCSDNEIKEALDYLFSA